MTDTPATVGVPVEPTRKMLEAMDTNNVGYRMGQGLDFLRDVWANGVAARPALTAAPVRDGGAVDLSDDAICKAAEAIRVSSVVWIDDPSEFTHLIKLTPAELRKLFAALTPREEAPAEAVEGLPTDLSDDLLIRRARELVDLEGNFGQLTTPYAKLTLLAFANRLAALRARSSEPVAGMTITLVETSPHLPAAGTLAIRKWDNHGLPVGTHRLYTHPAADPDKLRVAREALERMVKFAEALCLAADHYGVKHLDSDDMDDEAVRLQAATIAMHRVLADAAALNAEGL